MFGLDLEASWSILDAAYAIEDIDAINHVKSICLELYKAGMDGLSGDGYVVFGKDSDGEIDNQMIPWVQAEALIANLCAWKYQSISEGADYAMRIWDYIKDHLNDTVDTIAFRMYPMHDARSWVWQLMQYSLVEVLFMAPSKTAMTKTPISKPISPMIQYLPLLPDIAVFPKIL